MAFALAARMRYILARGPAPHSSQSLTASTALPLLAVRVLLTKSTAYSITVGAGGAGATALGAVTGCCRFEC